MTFQVYWAKDQQVEVQLTQETIWPGQLKTAELCGKHVQTISAIGKLEQEPIIPNFLQTIVRGICHSMRM